MDERPHVGSFTHWLTTCRRIYWLWKEFATFFVCCLLLLLYVFRVPCCLSSEASDALMQLYTLYRMRDEKRRWSKKDCDCMFRQIDCRWDYMIKSWVQGQRVKFCPESNGRTCLFSFSHLSSRKILLYLRAKRDLSDEEEILYKKGNTVCSFLP